MRKLLLVADGTSFSKSAFNFVRQLNETEPVMITGVFVPQNDYANLWSYASAMGTGAVYVPLLEQEGNEEVAKNIAVFERLCKENGMQYRIHRDFNDFVLPELMRESRFADLMILSGELFYKQIVRSNQIDYLKTAIRESECPVLIVPESFEFPSQNILAYDGSNESVYALKQFAYLFPKLAANKSLLVNADEDPEKSMPFKELILELVSQLYSNSTLNKIPINPKTDFSTWLTLQKGSILVSGSFSRSSFSELFKPSFVLDTLRDHRMPVFIAHR